MKRRPVLHELPEEFAQYFEAKHQDDHQDL